MKKIIVKGALLLNIMSAAVIIQSFNFAPRVLLCRDRIVRKLILTFSWLQVGLNKAFLTSANRMVRVQIDTWLLVWLRLKVLLHGLGRGCLVARFVRFHLACDTMHFPLIVIVNGCRLVEHLGSSRLDTSICYMNFALAADDSCFFHNFQCYFNIILF